LVVGALVAEELCGLGIPIVELADVGGLRDGISVRVTVADADGVIEEEW